MPRVYSATSRFHFCHPRGQRLSRKRIVVRAVLPLSRMAAFWIQNAAMRDNKYRDRITDRCFSRLHNALPPTPSVCQCSPAYTMRSAPLSSSSPPSIPREWRYYPTHVSVAGSPAAAMSRDRSKPRKPTTFYNPLTSENKMPSTFASYPRIQMKIDSHDDALYALSAVPRHRPQHIASSRRRAGGYISHFSIPHLSIIFSMY
jgi:hypothetical protein